jgi:thiamine biosynthesis protein ThiS
MSELSVTVNGEPLCLADGSTIADIVALLVGRDDPKGIAVAVDRTVIPHSEWPTTLATAHTQIEVVTAAAGG